MMMTNQSINQSKSQYYHVNETRWETWRSVVDTAMLKKIMSWEEEEYSILVRFFTIF